jgi:tetratricopeptide (TPR) repeat protein
MKPRAGGFSRWALAVFVFALALRALHLWQLRASPFLEVKLGDGGVYDAWARRIAAGDWLGREVFFQSPLYPYLLGTVYATLGDAPLLVRGLQCVLSAAACALLASAGASLFSPGAGIAAGLLLATYAPSIFLDALLQKSVLDVFFVCLALWLAARIARRPRLGLATALGLGTGLLAIARENALILVGVLAAWLLALPDVAGRRRLALAGAFAAGLAAAMLPVALRNFRVGGEFHLTTSQLGMNLYLGNHPGASGLYQPIDPSHSVESEPRGIKEMAERAVGRPLSPQEVSDYWTGQAVHYIVSQPLDWLRLMVRKLLLLLSAVELVDAEDQYLTADYSIVLRATGSFGHFGVLAPLAVLGSFVTWPRRREIWWIHAAIAAYTASVLIFYVVTRYRYPLVPFLALLAGAGLAGARSWFASRSRREVAVCGALALGLALLSNSVSGMPKASMAAVTHYNLANFFRRDGQLERAVEHYESARALDPGLENVGSNLAGTLVELGRPQEALSILQQGLAAEPSDAGLQRSLAGLLRAQGANERALEHYRRSLELDPADEEARRQLFDLYVELAAARSARGDAAAALALYRSALDLRPDAPVALWGAAWILATEREASLGRPAEAVVLAERAAALEPRLTPRMLEILAAGYAASGRFEPALARAREAVARLAADGRPAPKRLVQAVELYERGEAPRPPLSDGERR